MTTLERERAPMETSRLGPSEIEMAMQKPSTVFAAPEDVLGHHELTRQQKVEILWRWEYDAAEQSVAVEEGMPGEDSDLLGRIMLALSTLAPRSTSIMRVRASNTGCRCRGSRTTLKVGGRRKQSVRFTSTRAAGSAKFAALSLGDAKACRSR
jgi:hypothetical protein